MENNVNFDAKNQFFSNPEIPFSVKAGAAAVLLHTTVDYYKTSDGKEHFHAIYFSKDRETNTKTIGGMMNFTFGVENSMGRTNCAATLRKLADIYPDAESVLGHISDDSLLMNDEQVCNVFAIAGEKRFKFSPDGKSQNYEEYVKNNFNAFIAKVQKYYPGLLVPTVYDNLKKFVEESCKKKTINKTSENPAVETANAMV